MLSFFLLDKFRFRKGLQLILLIVGSGGLLQAQDLQLHGRFEHYSSQTGLSQNDVRAIFQDSDGYLWVGTHGGLNRFDGYHFKQYIRGENDRYNIASNLISAIAEDSLGNLWIGTDDKGLMQYARGADQFINIGGIDQSLTDKNISQVFSDEAGKIWALAKKGLNIIIPTKDGSWTIDRFYYEDNRIYTGFCDKTGRLWFGGQNGLLRYFGKTGQGKHQFIPYQIGSLDAIRHISENDTSLIVSDSRGLYAIPFKGLETNEPKAYVLSKQKGIGDHFSDGNRNIWYATNQGLYALYRKNGNIEKHKFENSLAAPNSISGNIILSIIEDNNNLIWIGTNGNGLNLYNPNKKNFQHFNRQNTPGSISFNKIRALESDSKGNIWIGTEGGGYNILKMEDEDYAFQSGFKNMSVPNSEQNFVFSIEAATFAKKEIVYIGTSAFSNLIQIEPAKGLSPVPISPRPGSPIFCLLQDSKRNLWAGSYGKGMYYYELNDDAEVVDMHKINVSNGLLSNIIRSVAEDKEGNIWIGTDSGVNKLIDGVRKAERSKVVDYTNIPGDSTSLSYDYVLPIFKSNNGTLWIGTLGGGLNKVLPGDSTGNDRFLRYSVNDGFPSNVIKSIEEDNFENLWIGTNYGLSKLNPVTGDISNYGIADGLQDLEFGELASIKLADGQMLFGGVNGFNSFYPEEITSDYSATNVVFNSLTVLNEVVVPGSELNGRVLLERTINSTELLKLKHKESSFSISFAGLNFTSPTKNKYSYILENFDDSWNNVGSGNRVAKYTNIPPGKYIFKVKASNADGYMGDDHKELVIEVSRPIWNTYFAKGIYAIIFLIALWFFRKYTIITNSKKSELQIEHLEKEKIEELSQLKLKFYTNVSHEFRTPLTLILGLVDRLKSVYKNLSNEERETYFNKIQRNSQILLNLINQLLDFRKVEQGQMPLNLVKGDISKYLKALFENFKELSRKKDIDYTLICEQSIVGYYDKDILERIMFNLLSNAFKFTEKEGEITVTIEKRNDEIYALEIIDTGIGIDQKLQSKIFSRFTNGKHRTETVGTGIGLSYTKSLVELYNGEISFTSKKGVGTKFVLELPFAESKFEGHALSDEEEIIEGFSKDVNWLVEDTYEVTDSDRNPVIEDTILIVEDNNDILFYLEDHFKSVYNIHLAKNGKEALEKCLQEDIDLVVSDVMMPEMDGFEFCEKLKEDERINHIPVILITARKSTDHRIKGYGKGADAYLGKPFEMVELEARIKSLLSTRKTLLQKIRKNISLEPNEIEVTSLDEKFMNRVMAFIEKNIGLTEFTVEMLASECGMSQLHLNKKLKVLVGKTANSFIRSIRLKRAAQLLVKNRYSVNEIMYEVGFIDAKYFRSCFKKEFGMTPTDYQKEHTLSSDESQVIN
ncbi:MAG: two-component regulator propeller domain-containing protein [Bacteroidota bacterium]